VGQLIALLFLVSHYRGVDTHDPLGGRPHRTSQDLIKPERVLTTSQPVFRPDSWRPLILNLYGPETAAVVEPNGHLSSILRPGSCGGSYCSQRRLQASFGEDASILNTVRYVGSGLGSRPTLILGSVFVAAILSIVQTFRPLKVPVRDYWAWVLPGLANFPINWIAELTLCACGQLSLHGAAAVWTVVPI
jgi:hypothetical protein